MTSNQKADALRAAELLAHSGIEVAVASAEGVTLTPADALSLANELIMLRAEPPMSSDTMLVYKDDELIARVEDYLGPIPHVGDWILHPRIDDDGAQEMDAHSSVVGQVKQVLLGIYGRPQAGVPAELFTGRQVNTIVVHL